jgi:hypothetical protein
MMAFIDDDPGDGTAGLCSGTVISSNVVLTAGHCAEDTSSGVPDLASGYRVVTGNVDWADSPRQVSGVSQVIIDPNFDPSTLHGDAALLVLSTPTTVTPVQLASDPADLRLLNAGTEETIAGWGETSPNSGVVEQLQFANTVVQTPQYCASHADDLGMEFDPDTQLCVIDAPTFADGQCLGDSGGPLLADDGGTSVEVGIISFGASNCETTQAGFLTRADAISSWATSWIQSVKPTPTTAAPPPPVTSAPSLPKPGIYRGATTQGRPIILRVTSSRNAISKLKFGFRLRCTRRRAPAYTFAPRISPQGWDFDAASGLDFSHSFNDSSGEHYHLAGAFTPGGAAAGTLTTRWRSHRYGNCSAGPLHWTAHLNG